MKKIVILSIIITTLMGQHLSSQFNNPNENIEKILKNYKPGNASSNVEVTNIDFNDALSKLNNMHMDIIQIPIVFHNIYKVDRNGRSVKSYCDYISYNNYSSDNDNGVCTNRILDTIKMLNEQYKDTDIEFVLHDDYNYMIHNTEPGFDDFYNNATVGSDNIPNANTIRRFYNIPNALNIYTTHCLGNPSYDCKPSLAGYSTYPNSLGSLGVFVTHRAMPSSCDTDGRAQVSVLAHEIGHFLSLRHAEENQSNESYKYSRGKSNSNNFMSTTVVNSSCNVADKVFTLDQIQQMRSSVEEYYVGCVHSNHSDYNPNA